MVIVMHRDSVHRIAGDSIRSPEMNVPIPMPDTPITATTVDLLVPEWDASDHASGGMPHAK